MGNKEEFIVSIHFIESEDYEERISNCLDVILKDLFSKGLLDYENDGRRISKKK